MLMTADQTQARTARAVVAVFRFKTGLLTVLAASALVGLAYGLTFGAHP